MPALGRADTVDEAYTRWRAGDDATAAGILQPTADGGDVRAQLLLATIYRDRDSAIHDDVRAFEWYRRAAEQGIAEAQYEVGLMYEVGIGVAVDAAEADFWYERAIGQGFCPGELDPMQWILSDGNPLPTLD